MIEQVLQSLTNSLERLIDRISEIESRIQSEKIRWTDEQISAGVITATSKAVRLEPETGTSDTLDTINGGYDGMVVVISNKDSGDTITLSNATGNLQIGSSVVHNDIYDTTTVIYRSSDAVWVLA
jgi:hypothetical protein